jgi:hypothetical protein
MGLYNLVGGQSPLSSILLGSIGLSRNDFYRYRDCYVDDGKIAVYTRGGGGNRECYCDDYIEDDDETVEFEDEQHLKGCVLTIHSKNRTHPLYLSDCDDDFDRTYATFYFKLPDDMKFIPEERRGEKLWADFFQAINREGK